ncbi:MULTISPECIES: hypothetical protein [unclassified Crossiella]|uniref:hypothetical protein n=1 Tax=unclassified Crossiella TaxID=2620835 RepID=UPI001FFE54F3|nr:MULTISPECIES: hypothetical protein [unclassified Crossiella]MCK2240851.1 hypothetical protein [Crossiella sp. S99.2]MCK2254005.1 hypothetical protein [Crossiella sp. S99.1]
MTMSTLFNGAIAIAVVVFVIIRRMNWHELTKRGEDVWVGPAVIAVIGLFQLKNKLGADYHIPPVDLTFLVLGLLLAAGAGVGLGRTSEVQLREGRIFTRMRGPAIGVWIGFIGLRVLLGFLGHAMGATLTSGGGAIMLTLGASLLVQSLVLATRAGHPVRH